MRTYTRRRPEHRLIEGVEDLCRLCLESAENTVPIFGGENETFAPLPSRIMLCVGLDISQEESLPNKICVNCYKELEHCYTFRKKCEVTYQKLKSHVLAVKEREYNKTMPVKSVEQGDNTGESVMAPQRHLVLTVDQNDHVELVNLSNVQLESLQVEDISTSNHTIPPAVPQATSSDLSLIMSAMLVELGVLKKEEGILVLVDENLRTVELEGDDNTKIVLQLVEEDEVKHEEPQEQGDKQPTPNSLKAVQEGKKKFVVQKPKALSKKTEGKQDLTCGVCHKSYASRSVLARHVRAHSGERPHACAHCGRRFAQRAVMLRHELVHRESRPFKCSECPKSFTQRGALGLHARRHAPPHARALALHRCPECDKVFLYASGLSRHMSTHSGRVFACALCRRAFSDKSSLTRHTRITHAAHAVNGTHGTHAANDTHNTHAVNGTHNTHAANEIHAAPTQR